MQISAQDPQIARTRIPVFIPIGLVHDIFMQPNINNVICIVYDEAKSNMKGVLLYVVHPADAHLLRDDFRLAKQSSLTKSNENAVVVETNSLENNHILSPTLHQSNESYRTGKSNRQHSPKRVLYVHENDDNVNRDIPSTCPPLNYTPLKGSYHSSRDNSAHRRHKSPRKGKPGHSSSKPGSDNGSKHRRKYRSRSPQKTNKTPIPTKDSAGEDFAQEQIDPHQQQQQQQQQEQLLAQQQQQQQVAAWQGAQQMPLIPMGIYNR